ncbi:MAG: hypothetical protein JETT_2914 [Candidatus Jettenia ecosi]|uniref:Uncharacterized protein n=1 Tax=Candidatus Jettenia ecosi TaxID=2494326 RepID=A0A533Q872_9BACT|nr:MAG: hypothetical protein JETT_2914 [Candidatus Jettenia ecosi]
MEKVMREHAPKVSKNMQRNYSSSSFIRYRNNPNPLTVQIQCELNG